MIYATVCSGIEAPSLAWHPLGWRAAFFSEIEKFPSRLLAHHYPTTPNHGDMTKFESWPDANIDLLCGGTPCQSFSVAGLRGGLADPRGNLMLTYLAIAARYRPRWLVWENVPGVLSSNSGRDFGTLLGAMGKLGYGFAYRILDAQYVRVESHPRAVPQRRRRVFVVGCLGGWPRAAAALFEREILLGHPPPRRQAWENVAPTISARTRGGGGLGSDFEIDGGLIAGTITSAAGRSRGAGSDTSILVAAPSVSPSLKARDAKGPSSDGDGDGAPLVVSYRTAADGSAYCSGERTAALTTGTDKSANVICFDSTQITSPTNRSNPQPGDACHTLGKHQHPPTIAIAGNIIGRAEKNGGNGSGWDDSGACYTLTKTDQHGALINARVRRLTPRECERLQGMPDDYTLIPRASDSARYKAIGNSMAVNVMSWLGRRIASVDAIGQTQ